MSSKNTTKYKKDNKQSRTIKSRKRWSVFEKLQIVEESKNSALTTSAVARKYNIGPNQLYLWRRLEKEGKLKAFKAGERVVPAFAVKRLETRNHELKQLIEKKNKEIDDLKRKVTGKTIISELEQYPHIKMILKYNLFR
ncbi:MAG: transposase [Desulfobacteraceae bacterium]|nr:transposase [Desulfobacteraceae bacterium]